MSRKKAIKLKQLKGYVGTLKEEVSMALQKYKDAQQEYKNKKGKLERAEEELSQLLQDNNKIGVTEHAMLRYLERIKGIDLDEIENEILTEGLVKLIETTGGNVTYEDREKTIVVKNNLVITVKTKGSK